MEKLRGILRALVRILFKAGEDEFVELGRDPHLDALRRRNRFGLDVIEEHLHRRVAVEHELAGQQIVRHAPECVHVGPAVDLALAEDELRGHVGGRAGRRVRRGHQGLLHCGLVRKLDETEAVYSHADSVACAAESLDYLGVLFCNVFAFIEFYEIFTGGYHERPL